MPRRLGEDRPPRAVRGGGRNTSQLLVGLCTHATVVGRTLLRIGQVEGADAGAMADPAIDIKLVGALPVFVCLVEHDFGIQHNALVGRPQHRIPELGIRGDTLQYATEAQQEA